MMKAPVCVRLPVADDVCIEVVAVGDEDVGEQLPTSIARLKRVELQNHGSADRARACVFRGVLRSVIVGKLRRIDPEQMNDDLLRIARNDDRVTVDAARDGERFLIETLPIIAGVSKRAGVIENAGQHNRDGASEGDPPPPRAAAEHRCDFDSCFRFHGNRVCALILAKFTSRVKMRL